MRTTGAHALSERGTTRDHDRGRTPAQWYCTLAGAALLLAGLFGFIADATFDTSGSGDSDRLGNADGQLQGDSFLGFEVNGWHNVVHLASGVLLLLAARKRKSAKTVALAFGIVYGLVAIIGLIDGNDVLGIIPVNAADNILHIALSAVGILAALASRADDHDHDHVRGHDREVAGETVSTRRVPTGERDTRFEREVEARDLNEVERR